MGGCVDVCERASYSPGPDLSFLDLRLGQTMASTFLNYCEELASVVDELEVGQYFCQSLAVFRLNHIAFLEL